MPRLLKLYLVMTGIPALLALAFPDLVTLGLFMLIIPGLILGLAPTAFLWGCIYSVGHWLVRSRFGGVASAFGAAALTAAALWAIPQPSILAARATQLAYRLPAVAAPAPIHPAGDIRLESESPRWDNANQQRPGFRPFSCDNRCIALLFEPGVRSVTVNTSAKLSFAQIREGQGQLNELARTYRLLPKAQCGGNAYLPDLGGRVGQFGKTLDDNRAISAEWNVRLTSEFCLLSQAPITRYDLLLRTGRWQPPEGRDAADTSADYAEARGASNQVLMRIFNLRTSALAAPLWIEGRGGIENFGFGWGRGLLPRRVSTNWEGPQHQLDDLLVVRRTADVGRVLAATRVALQSAVADPARDKESPVFNSVRDYLELLQKDGTKPTDMPLIKALIADPRLDDLDGAWLLPKVFSWGDLDQLRPAIVAKLAAMPASADPRTRGLGKVLAEWPQGSFAKLSQAEIALLGDADHRRRANGLISRLADMGAAAAPLLVGISDSHMRSAATLRLIARQREDDETIPQMERSYGTGAHRDTALAAVAALCRLGPAARGELGHLLELEARLDWSGFGRRDWDRMMIRIGKPVNQVRKPADLSGTEASYQRNLGEFLARFDPARSCV